MLAVTKTAAPAGFSASVVTAEVNVGRGLPYFTVTGEKDAALRGMSERIRYALLNSGFRYPQGRITVNLSPAHINKKGSHYDLAAAVALLKADGQLSAETDDVLFLGELGLDGRVLPVMTALSMVIGLREQAAGLRRLFVPKGNQEQCRLAAKKAGLTLIPVSTLRRAVDILSGLAQVPSPAPPKLPGGASPVTRPADFADVKGQEAAKSAIAVAMAGAHSILLVGPPGAGKTMMARRVPGILPPMGEEEILETAGLYSAAGLLAEGEAPASGRPFRQIGPRITESALLGSGSRLMPGEVSLAHNGVLFIDEMPELPRKLLDGLRGPMEDGVVTVSAAGAKRVLPADFVLIGAANPCRCGFFGDPRRRCSCTPSELAAYRRRLTGPVADRIDMTVEVQRADRDWLKGAAPTGSAEMAAAVLKAREIQNERYRGLPFRSNGRLDDGYTERFCGLGQEEKRFMDRVYDSFGMSMRRYKKILRIARTIADMAAEENVRTEHLAAALQYTRPFAAASSAEAAAWPAAARADSGGGHAHWEAAAGGLSAVEQDARRAERE